MVHCCGGKNLNIPSIPFALVCSNLSLLYMYDYYRML